jgi:antitoxin ParD1/3/4
MGSRTTMNISVPPRLRDWIRRRVREGGFGTASEFVRHVLREAWVEEEGGELERQILEGIRSGPSTPMTKKNWADIRREGLRRIKARRRAALRKSARARASRGHQSSS